MDKKTILSKTAKGVREASGQTSTLAREYRNFLKEVNGKLTIEELQQSLRTDEYKVMEVMAALVEADYVRALDTVRRAPPPPPPQPAPARPAAKPAAKPAQDTGEDLDFTAFVAPPPPPPQPDRSAELAREKAQREAAEQAKRAAEEKAKQEAEARAKLAAVARAKLEAEAKARHEAEQRARQEAEARAKLEAEMKARQAAEEKARKEAEERVRRETEERVRREMEEKARKEAEEKARREAEEGAKREAEEKARKEAEERARKEEEERIRRETEERVRREMEEKARKEAEERARKEAEEKARREAEEKARKEAEEKVRKEAEEKARREAEERARKEAEEQARREAEDKARKEAEEKARREAEERARKEAEEQARREAEEARAREEIERARRAAEEAARQEAEERARRLEEERSLREAEEKVRREAEAQARQEAEERAIREAEELVRQEAEKQAAAEAAVRERQEHAPAAAPAPAPVAAARPARLSSSGGLGKLLTWSAVLLVVLAALGFGALQFISFDGRVAEFEKAASEQFGQPVKIRAVHLSVLPRAFWRLDGVSVGAEGQIKVPQLRAVAGIGTLLGGGLEFEALELDGPVIGSAGAAWLLSGKPQAQRIRVGRIVAKGAKLDLPQAGLPPLDAQVELEADGAWRRIVAESSDRGTRLELAPEAGRLRFDLSAGSFTPFGAPLQLADFSAAGTLDARGMEIAKFGSRMHGGVVEGRARLSWASGWRLDGDLDAKQLDAGKLVPGLLAGNRLEGKGTLALRAAEAAALFDAPVLQGSLAIRNGSLQGVDFGRLLQGEGSTGTTQFSELTGQLVHERGITQLRDLRLSAGKLTANGSVEAEAGKGVRGRLTVLLRLAGEQRRADVLVGGTPEKIEWRR